MVLVPANATLFSVKHEVLPFVFHEDVLTGFERPNVYCTSVAREVDSRPFPLSDLVDDFSSLEVLIRVDVDAAALISTRFDGIQFALLRQLKVNGDYAAGKESD